ncbi:MAG: hypothetical protein E7426_08190 [Ruminococcaceae bacterium]|nr:hypothetical protein [Oscillospiraceae bacterium]
MKITWFGHACFGVESVGYRVVLDPYDVVKGYPPLHLTADEVLCSHDHFDHNYRPAVSVRPSSYSPFTVDTVAACHDDLGGARRGPNTIHILTAEGQTVVHLGDLGHQLSAEQAAPLLGCDVLLIPVGGFYTIDAAGARMVIDALQPRIAVPMHYRRGPCGFPEIGTLEDFLPLFPPEQVHRLADSSFDPAETPPGVVVPVYPL